MMYWTEYCSRSWTQTLIRNPHASLRLLFFPLTSVCIDHLWPDHIAHMTQYPIPVAV